MVKLRREVQLKHAVLSVVYSFGIFIAKMQHYNEETLEN